MKYIYILTLKHGCSVKVWMAAEQEVTHVSSALHVFCISCIKSVCKSDSNISIVHPPIYSSYLKEKMSINTRGYWLGSFLLYSKKIVSFIRQCLPITLFSISSTQTLKLDKNLTFFSLPSFNVHESNTKVRICYEK